MPCDYSKYPPGWKTEIRPRILARARNKCEMCGVANYSILSNGTKVVLTIAHLDHDIENNVDGNLAALCQRCHLGHDRIQHAKTKRKNRNARTGQMEMIA